MNNNGWITDRLPTEEDANNAYVYNCRGKMVLLGYIAVGEAWKPIPKCEPYVKPKRYTAEWSPRLSAWMISYKSPGNAYAMHCVPLDLNCDQHREAAERIAAIYEEVMP